MALIYTTAAPVFFKRTLFGEKDMCGPHIIALFTDRMTGSFCQGDDLEAFLVEELRKSEQMDCGFLRGVVFVRDDNLETDRGAEEPALDMSQQAFRSKRPRSSCAVPNQLEAHRESRRQLMATGDDPKDHFF
ncbi:hypothetical protein CAPTEDRAFT_204032 [Capitella teleta]|uniref:Uncharacterized protein n=1 Tax=Capitella teleta TaxID=283909 RepID=R7UJN5_CAPTE|nr:hypothetical protein CAPTEDRAFT_204032 [Capitella teleta]|eukprot:ELU06425.1 hypothetical protein CAPTEDRAFT_204032 [Capitella teleta]